MDFKGYLYLNKKIPTEELETKIEYLLKDYNSKVAEIRKFHKSKHIYEVYGSAEVEGNSLDLVDTKMLLEDKIIIDKPYKDIIETLNLNRALNKYNNIKEYNIASLLDVHREITVDLIEDNYVGKLRDCDVYITNTEFIPYHDSEVEFRLENALYVFRNSKQQLKDIFKLKWDIVKIHPFIDGNGRLSRLVMNSLLNHRGYPRLIIEGRIKSVYYKALGKDVEHWYTFCYNLMIYQMIQVLEGGKGN